MIVDPSHFKAYYDVSRLTISRLDDPLGDFYLKDWFTDFPHKDRIFVHSFPLHEDDVKEVVQFCRRHTDHVHLIILCGQAVPMDPFNKLIAQQEKVFILNDSGHTSDRSYPVFNTHRVFGKGYIGKVPFVDWAKRKHTLSALSLRYEPHRWIMTAHLNRLNRKDHVFSFHNAVPECYTVEHFVSNAKIMCNFDVDKQMADSVQELIDRAPVVPEGLHNPRPNGMVDDMTWTHDTADLHLHMDSKVNLTMEGQFVDNGNGCNITEKTLKCLATGCFPLHVGQSGFYDFLRSMGFNFNIDFDLSYDDASGDTRREKLHKLMSIVSDLKPTNEMEQCAMENYEWFHNGWFEHCEKQNKAVLQRLSARIKDTL